MMFTPSFACSLESRISNYELETINELAQHIKACSREQFTGQLDLEIPSAQTLKWSLFFRLGRLIWGTSQVHPLRRWYRQLVQHCPLMTASDRGNVNRLQCRDYETLAALVRQRKIPQEKMAAVVGGTLIEILFDVFQLWKQRRYPAKAKLTYHEMSLETVASPLVLLRTEQVWQQVTAAWEGWQQAGLGDWSPNQAPVIWDADELRRQTSLLAYHNLTTLVDGDRTIRDLAVRLKQTPLSIAQSIEPYIRRGAMGLVGVQDFSASVPSAYTAASLGASSGALSVPPSANFTQAVRPLVAYIDDSRFDSLTMNRILAQAGCRFINVREPVQALPILLEQKPDLIFLDLLMPVTNGYEVCAQIRRISAFKETPIIIVTASDGIVDRVRAKLVGSSGFISKPIDAEKVLPVLQHYLPGSRLLLQGR